MNETNHEPIDRYEILRLQSGEGLVEIVPGLGGLVRRLRLADSRLSPTGRAQDILASPDAKELSENRWFRGRLLFPFNDRIPGGAYRWEGRLLRLPINSRDDGSALHGLVYDRPFDAGLASARPDSPPRGEEEATLRLTTRILPDEFAGYPFDVTLVATYRLAATSFALELEARNTGAAAAPVAFGWHPYFALGGPVDHVTLQADCTHYVPVDASLLPSGERSPVDGTNFDFRRGRRIADSVLDIALTAPRDGRVSLCAGRSCLELALAGFPYLQLFTHPDRRSLAVEPVTAATNAFNHPELGLTVLEPGAVLSGRIDITYRSLAGEPRASSN